MKTIVLSLLVLFCFTGVQAQMPAVQHIARLEIDKKKNKIFSSRDSSLTMTIDTLIMKDRSRLVFYGKKDVTLKVKHAEIGKDVVIVGTDGKNNGSDMDLSIRFEKLGNLLLTTAGLDASNGTKTFPNGNGGELTFKYLTDGLIPQQEDKKAEAYVSIDTKAGGYSVNSQSDIRNIISRIGSGSRPLGQLPQGQVYSGSPGKDGKSEVIPITEFSKPNQK